LNGENQILEEFIAYAMLLISYNVNGRASAARSASQKDVKHQKRYNLNKAARRVRSAKRSAARLKIRSAKRAILILQFTKNLQNFLLINIILFFFQNLKRKRW
jgi:hypothetical protein